MIKKTFIGLCLIAALPSYPEDKESLQENNSNSVCKEDEIDKDPINWKKILVITGVFVVGIVTFSLVATQNNK